MGNESRHKWSHQIQNEGNIVFPLYGVMYTGILNGQTEVLGEGQLVNITHADEGGLASQEGVGDLRVTVSIMTSTLWIEKEHTSLTCCSETFSRA